LATSLRHNLNDDYKVQGFIKPGSHLTGILNSDIQDIKDFTKNDVMTVWAEHWMLAEMNLQKTN
jgi:hypothetical protein